MLSLYIFILALCSIAYELLLGQILSAFLGNTVLRYSITIGLYMMSMGIGALLARKQMVERPLIALQKVELILSVIGSTSLSLLFLLQAIGINSTIFSLIAHSLIIIIGILTGLELPLLFAVGKLTKRSSQNVVLGVDYLGAFAGTILFAFFLYPVIGLFSSAFLIASLNAFVGVMLIYFRQEQSQISISIAGIQGIVFLLCCISIVYATQIQKFWMYYYLNA